MDINTLKLGFNAYLQELNEMSNKNYQEIDSDYSIFKYSDEFKTYVSDEVQTDASIFSMSVNDILDMEIVNGKLVDPEKEAEKAQIGDSFETTSESEETNDQTDNTQLQQGQETNLTDSSEANNEEIMPALLNEMFELDYVQNAMDSDSNGEINEDEMQSFLTSISGFDNNEKDISLEDIITALDEIKNGTFNQEEEIEETENEVEELAATTPSTSNSTGTSGSSGGSGVSGTSGASGVSGSGSAGGSGSSGTTGTQEKTLQTMSKEELNSELTKANSDLSDKQAVLDGVLDGSDPEIKAAQENVDKNYEEYQEQLKAVDEEMAKQVDDIKTRQDAKQAEIDAKEGEISDQECAVSEAETTYNNAVTTRETLETTLQGLESADQSDMDATKKGELNSQISELKGKISEAKQAEEDTKEAWDKAKEKLGDLNEEKSTLEQDKADIDKDMSDLEAKISEKYPEVQQSMDNYNNAKTELETKKQTAITNAKSDIQEAQDYVNEVQTAISEYDDKEMTKEYMGAFGDELIEFAEQFLGYNEADGSADKFISKYGLTSSTPWCAAFVEYCLENSGVDIPDWYQSVSNKIYCPSVYSAAKNNGAVINSSEAQTGDIVLFDWEVDGEKDHIGLIVSIDNGVVTTIEGNSSNKVQKKTYNLNDSRLTYCKIAA